MSRPLARPPEMWSACESARTNAASISRSRGLQVGTEPPSDEPVSNRPTATRSPSIRIGALKSVHPVVPWRRPPTVNWTRGASSRSVMTVPGTLTVVHVPPRSSPDGLLVGKDSDGTHPPSAHSAAMSKILRQEDSKARSPRCCWVPDTIIEHRIVSSNANELRSRFRWTYQPALAHLPTCTGGGSEVLAHAVEIVRPEDVLEEHA